MNLFELDELIKHPEVQKDAEMLAFYKKKRIELVKEINSELSLKRLNVKIN